MKRPNLTAARILVVGAGLTGLSVMRHLGRQGIAFDVADEKLAERQALQDSQIRPLLDEAELHSVFDPAVFVRYDTLLLSPGIPRNHPAVKAAVDRGREVIGDIELFARSASAPVFAVTGSNGKSTVVSWLAHVLDACGVVNSLVGNIGRPALDCLHDDVQLYVLELSSYQLESTVSLKPVAAAVLNVSADHLDRYVTLDEYAAVKRRIYDGAAHLVFNRDDARTWPDEHRSPVSQRSFALHAVETADYRVLSASGVTGLYRADTCLLDARHLAMPGRHNLANALAILALLETLDLAHSDVKRGLCDFPGLPHRTEFIAEIDSVRWYNDSKATNVDACIKAIEAMPGPVLLLAGGQGKGGNFRLLRPAVQRAVRLVLLFGEDRDLIASALEGLTQLIYVADIEEAVATAASRSQPGDVVLLSPACASFDMFRDFIDRGEQFRTLVEARAA